MEDTYVRFEPSPLKMQAWRDRFIASSSSVNTSPSELYAKAIPVFLDWKKKLLASRVWRQADDADGGVPPGMLFVLEMTERSPLLLKRSSTQSYTSTNSYLDPTTNGNNNNGVGVSKEGAVLAIPSELSAFIEYQSQLEEILQDPLLFYPYLDKHHELVLEAFDESDVPASKVLTDVFYLLQLVIPGMLIIVHDQLWFGDSEDGFKLKKPPVNGHGRRTTTTESTSSSTSQNSAPATLTRIRRGIPPAKWIVQNRALLEGIFGSELTRAFESAAKDPRRALWTTIYSADGQRREHGHAFNASEAMEEIDIPRMARVPLGVTPGRGAHNLYTDFTQKSQTL